MNNMRVFGEGTCCLKASSTLTTHFFEDRPRGLWGLRRDAHLLEENLNEGRQFEASFLLMFELKLFQIGTYVHKLRNFALFKWDVKYGLRFSKVYVGPYVSIYWIFSANFCQNFLTKHGRAFRHNQKIWRSTHS